MGNHDVEDADADVEARDSGNAGGALRLLLHEGTSEAGEAVRTWLEVVAGELLLRVGTAPVITVPERVLSAIMRRYGRPLAEGFAAQRGLALVLASGVRVWSLRHLGRFDVIAKDYIVYEEGGQEPLTELATSVSAALCFVMERSRPEQERAEPV